MKKIDVAGNIRLGVIWTKTATKKCPLFRCVCLSVTLSANLFWPQSNSRNYELYQSTYLMEWKVCCSKDDFKEKTMKILPRLFLSIGGTVWNIANQGILRFAVVRNSGTWSFNNTYFIGTCVSRYWSQMATLKPAPWSIKRLFDLGREVLWTRIAYKVVP